VDEQKVLRRGVLERGDDLLAGDAEDLDREAPQIRSGVRLHGPRAVGETQQRAVFPSGFGEDADLELARDIVTDRERSKDPRVRLRVKRALVGQGDVGELPGEPFEALSLVRGDGLSKQRARVGSHGPPWSDDWSGLQGGETSAALTTAAVPIGLDATAVGQPPTAASMVMP
jgi:hypothetical protein